MDKTQPNTNCTYCGVPLIDFTYTDCLECYNANKPNAVKEKRACDKCSAPTSSRANMYCDNCYAEQARISKEKWDKFSELKAKKEEKNAIKNATMPKAGTNMFSLLDDSESDPESDLESDLENNSEDENPDQNNTDSKTG
jgi:hypothetical protein